MWQFWWYMLLKIILCEEKYVPTHRWVVLICKNQWKKHYSLPNTLHIAYFTDLVKWKEWLGRSVKPRRKRRQWVEEKVLEKEDNIEKMEERSLWLPPSLHANHSRHSSTVVQIMPWSVCIPTVYCRKGIKEREMQLLHNKCRVVCVQLTE